MNNETHSQMLGRIAAYVEDFAESPADTTLVCVLRLLAAFYQLKAEELRRTIERE